MINSLILFIEKILYSGSRFLIVYLCLNNIPNFEIGVFFNLIYSIIFLTSFVHLGSDLSIVGLFAKGKSKFKIVDKIFSLRILLSVICIFIWSIFHLDNLLFTPIIFFILLGYSFPYGHLFSLAYKNLIFNIRLRIEILSFMIKILLLVYFYPDYSVFVLFILYFMTELLISASNLNLIKNINLKKILSCNFFKSFPYNLIAKSALISLFLFLFQRGDIYTYSYFNDEFNMEIQKIILTQQILDFSGLFTFALIPFIVEKKLPFINKKLVFILIPSLLLFSTLYLFYKSNIDYFLLSSFNFKILPFDQLLFLFLLSFIGYGGLLYLNINLKLECVLTILISTVLLRLAYFYFIIPENIFLYFLIVLLSFIIFQSLIFFRLKLTS